MSDLVSSRLKRLMGHLYGCLHDPDVVWLFLDYEGFAWSEDAESTRRDFAQTLSAGTRWQIADVFFCESIVYEDELNLVADLPQFDNGQLTVFAIDEQNGPVFSFYWRARLERVFLPHIE